MKFSWQWFKKSALLGAAVLVLGGALAGCGSDSSAVKNEITVGITPGSTEQIMNM